MYQLYKAISGLFFLLFTYSTASGQSPYCTPSIPCGTDKQNGWVTSVKFNTLSNQSACTGYTLYPESGNTTTTVERGSSYNINLDVEGSSYNMFNVKFRMNHRVHIYIDFNSDGIFDETSEKVIGVSTTTITKKITIPFNAALGKTRLRVRTRNSEAGADGMKACDYAALETEDYTITIGEKNASVPSCPIAFTPLNNATNVARNPIFSWQGATGGDQTTYDFYLGKDIASLTPIALDIKSIDGFKAEHQLSSMLDPNTTYYYKVTAKNSNGINETCAIQKFTTKATLNEIVYCTPISDCSTTAIKSVKLNTLSTTSSCSNIRTGYILYPTTGANTTTLVKGQSYSMTIVSYPSRHNAIWIDFNQNGSFEKAEFFTLPQTADNNSNITLSGTITVPFDAVTGTTRMRVRLVTYDVGDLLYNEACESFNESSSSSNGEIEDYTITISAPPTCSSLKAAFTKTDVSGCSGQANGAILVTPSGGVPPYSIAWTGGNASGFNPTGLAAGTYYGVVSDVNGCVYALNPVYISEPAPLSIKDVAIINAKCDVVKGGSLIVHHTGGVGPFTYDWGTAAASERILEDLPAGSYQVTIKDSKGCAVTSEVATIQPLHATYLVQNNRCNYPLNSIVTVNTAGGTPPYRYEWENAPPNSSTAENNIFHLPAGAYSVNIIDAVGCIFSIKDIPITSPPPIEVKTYVTSPDCNKNGEGGAIKVKVEKGEAPFVYEIYKMLPNGAYLEIYPTTVEDSEGLTFLDLPVDSYQLNVKDVTGCSSPPINLSLLPIAAPTPSQYIACAGITTEIKLQSEGYDIRWFEDAEGTKVINTGVTFALPKAISQNITYFIANYLNGCQSEIVPLNVIAYETPIRPAIYYTKGNVCSDGSVLLFTKKQSNAFYEWYRDESKIEGAGDNTYRTTTAGKYKVKVIINYCSQESDEMDVEIETSNTAPYLTLPDVPLTNPQQEVTNAFEIRSNTCWKISEHPDWIRPDQLEGSGNFTVSYYCFANPEDSEREGNITIVAGGISKIIQVTQNGPPAQLNVLATFITAAASGSDQTIKIVCNRKWRISTDKEWLQVSPATGELDGAFTLTILPNLDVTQRTGTFTVRAAEKVVTITVKQSNTLISPRNFVFPPTEDSKILKIAVPNSWTLSSDSPWITTNIISGSGSKEIIVTTENNDASESRTAFLTVTYSNGLLKQTIDIAQEGRKLEFSESSLEFNAPGENKKLSILSNADWAITENTDWLTVDLLKGKSNQVITIAANENASVISRSAKIIVSSGGILKEIDVYQPGIPQELAISDEELPFNVKGESKSFKVLSNIEWEIESKDEWVSLNKNNGQKNETITITVSENKTTDSRTATLVISGGGFEKHLLLKQEGITSFIHISDKDFKFDFSRSSKPVEITSNDSWRIKVSASWINLSQMEGSSSETILITVSENTKVEHREGQIEISGKSTIHLIDIIQSGALPVMDLSSDELSFTADGEEKNIEVLSNTNWTIIEAPEWLTIKPMKENGSQLITIKALANEETLERSDSFKITSKDITRKVFVKQEGKKIKSDVGNPNEINIFPNPSTGLINVSLKVPQNEFLIIELLNALGKKVHSWNCVAESDEMEVKLDMKTIRKGVYFLRIINGEKTSVKRILLM